MLDVERQQARDPRQRLPRSLMPLTGATEDDPT
jgi:hypothetical protein